MTQPKTLEELKAAQENLWNIAEGLYQQAHAAERKAKAATKKWLKAKKQTDAP